jgi:hypothetical protein
MSPISATGVMAVSRPIPGSAMSASTRGSGLASLLICRSSRPIGWPACRSTHSSRPRPPAAPVGAPARPATPARPGSTGRAGAGTPRSASTAWTRFSQAGGQPHQARPGGAAGRADRGRAAAQVHAAGSRSARSSCASVSASTLSFLQPGRGDLLAAGGVDQVRLELEVVEQAGQPTPAVGGLKRHRVPGGKTPRMAVSSAGSLGGCGCVGRYRRGRRWRPGSACGGRPCRRPHSLRASFPALVAPPSLGLSG